QHDFGAVFDVQTAHQIMQVHGVSVFVVEAMIGPGSARGRRYATEKSWPNCWKAFCAMQACMGDQLTHITAWLATAAFGASAAARLRLPGSAQPTDALRRRIWTTAVALLWVHVACAFQFQHHWSHTAAYAHTAQQTGALVGLD